jgi:hypothetical protein
MINFIFFCNIIQGKHKNSGTDHILLLHLLGELASTDFLYLYVVSKVCVCFQRHTKFLQRIINDCPISSFAAERSKSECAGFHLTSFSTSSSKIWQMGVYTTTTYQVCLPHVLQAAKVFEESMNDLLNGLLAQSAVQVLQLEGGMLCLPIYIVLQFLDKW